MEAFIFILIILGTSTLLFYLGEGWKRYLDKQCKNYFDEEEKQDKNSTEKTGGANPWRTLRIVVFHDNFCLHYVSSRDNG